MVQYFEKIASAPGRAMFRDVLGADSHTSAGKCDGFLRQQITVIRERAVTKGEHPLSADRSIHSVLASLMHRILFVNATPTTREVHELVQAMEQVAGP